MRMLQASDGTGFLKEARTIACQSYLENLDSSLGLEIDMLTEIDISETTLSEQAGQTIVAKLLARTIIGHPRTSSWEPLLRFIAQRLADEFPAQKHPYY